MEEQNLEGLKNQHDAKPSEELEKIVNNDDDQQNQPKTTGTGSNHPVQLADSLIIDEDLKERLADEPDSLGVDLDGTNPGSRSHPMDEE